MGTVYQTQSQGYENSGYQAPPRLWERCFPQLLRHWGKEARLPPLTLQEPTSRPGVPRLPLSLGLDQTSSCLSFRTLQSVKINVYSFLERVTHKILEKHKTSLNFMGHIQ